MWLNMKKRKRGFEKVSYDQFICDIKEHTCNGNLRNRYSISDISKFQYLNLPQRATTKSSGYDFVSPIAFILHEGETIKFPLGIKTYMLDDEELKLYPRSGMGINYKIKIDNTVPKIDSDYYENIDNDGDIILSLTNTGKKDWYVGIGDRICQGSFYKYLITDDDNPKSNERVGGIESTGVK